MRRCLNTILCGMGLLFGASSAAQRVDWRTKIDGLVSRADSLSMLSQETFHIYKFLPDDRQIRETWHYTELNGEVLVFEVHYFVDTIEHLEAYYLDREQVVCMEQYEIAYLPLQDDKINWGTVGFFQGPVARQWVTMGEVPSTVATRSPYDHWYKFRSRFRELSAQRTLSSRHDRN